MADVDTAARPTLRPTAAGWGYLSVLVVLFLMGVNYTNNLVFALAFLLAAAGALSLFLAWRNLAGVRLRCGQAAPVFAGQSVHLPLHIGCGARSRWAMSFTDGTNHPFDARDRLDAGEHHEQVRLPPMPRGRQALPAVWLASRFPLGLAEVRLPVPMSAPVIVWPSPAGHAPAAPAALTGDAADQLGDLRRYQPGDSPRRIDWRAYARHDQLHTRQFEGDSGNHARVIDWQHTSGDLETRLSLLARQIIEASADGVDYGLHLPGRRIAAASGESQRHACLTALATCEALGEQS